MDTKNIPQGYCLRIGTKGAGCAGVSYLLGFDKPANDDKTFEVNDLSILISKKHMLYVAGLVLDFHEDVDARGFMFSNTSDTAEKEA